MSLYRPLRASFSIDRDDTELGISEEKASLPLDRITTKAKKWRLFTVKSALILSVIFNFILAALFLSHPRVVKEPERSQFAGLTRNVPRAWTDLNGSNDTEQDAFWSATSYDLGNIALADEYARSLGLPRAQRFPWDHSSGIYLINVYHNLHCVKTLRTALVEFRSGRQQSSPWGHLAHCLLVLRDEAMCNADDTPRYTGYQPHQKSGLGQVRMCRDWSQLEAWAREHTACWRHVGDIYDEGFRELDRYRFCPEGSKYKEMSETLWLKGDWWRKFKATKGDGSMNTG